LLESPRPPGSIATTENGCNGETESILSQDPNIEKDPNFREDTIFEKDPVGENGRETDAKKRKALSQRWLIQLMQRGPE